MAQALWRGDLIQRSRTVSGIFLLAYAFLHFLNIAAGLVSPDFMHQVQEFRRLLTGHPPGQIVLFSALFTHVALALWQVASRRTLRMSLAQALQLFLGLAIPFQLIQHLVYTSYAPGRFGLDDDMTSIILLMWNSPEVWHQYLLLLVVWVHGCIGLHMWLRLTNWWSKLVPYMIGLAVAVPAFALAGLLTEGRRIWMLYTAPDSAQAIRNNFNWPDREGFAQLASSYNIGFWVFVTLLGMAIASYYLRRFLRKRKSLQIRYENGTEITIEHGLTLLEISQLNGIPHTSLCGGKGRCTTCRIEVTKGQEDLPPPSSAEARTLKAIKARDNVRLACQIRPTASLSIQRVYQPKGKRQVHSAQGVEKTIAVLFLDIRGFTSRSAGLLPYDIVFLLNRFFDAIVPEITKTGGTVDKYMGDGLLALFEMDNPEHSALAGITAVGNIGVALARFNRLLASEGEDPVRIGMGLHTGTVVLGEIGTNDNAPRTLIGAAVNAASRLESKTKELGVELLISDQVLQAAGMVAPAEMLQDFELRGVDHPVCALPVRQASTLDSLLSMQSDPDVTTFAPIGASQKG
ncbi:adenylate/guanylate cyclase domain-containing protein [Pseudophaeobacter sp.]|uniref:adenylate/guanylate cyclase domain-containing protein n=1 Tax=Pseudophaeobacter sp. TaxID=1971739 RepID=UPI003299B92C